jgi:hypothetical protein
MRVSNGRHFFDRHYRRSNRACLRTSPGASIFDADDQMAVTGNVGGTTSGIDRSLALKEFTKAVSCRMQYKFPCAQEAAAGLQQSSRGDLTSLHPTSPRRNR